MVMEEGVKGTITSLSSIFPVEEAQKAAKRVQDAIADRQKELEHLHSFISDNINLVNLVQKLPDELFHDVMVPFGKAAFFPGRLVHSNEFLVLLGEGYYAERTCKQTIEILQRRGKFLESQVESLKANLMDLKAEASFFDATAAEAAEGLVEIREDYVEENPAEKMPKSGLSKPDSSEAENVKLVAEDEEYARIMSRLDELEKEELAAQSANEDDDEEAETDFGCSINQESFDDHFKSLELRSQVLQSKVKTPITTATKEPLGGNFLKQDSSDHPPLKVQFEDSKIHYVPKDLESKKMIGSGYEVNGVYLLVVILRHQGHRVSNSNSSGSELVNQIILWHNCLGHLSFSSLKCFFPKLFESVQLFTLECESCQLGKYCRQSFKPSNKRSTFAFDIVHTDVWGPYLSYTCHGRIPLLSLVCG